MNKKQLKVLEEAFWAEVEDRLPYQTKSKVAEKLAEDGFLEAVKMPLSRYQVVVAGYVLTHAGRIVYCSTCPEPDA